MKRTLSNREVVLGVTGSIAAYKACELASRLIEFGARVTPALTKNAARLVGPATFDALTGRRAITEMFEPIPNPEIEHITVANRAHLFLIAPASANILAKAANGIADDWLSTTLLATRAPVLFAPAMNENMFAHPATQANIETLRSRGCQFVGPESGRFACGTAGLGRMAAPMTIIEAALPLISERNDLTRKHIVITSGSTHEPIDPVRFIGNRSSGKMGRALALEALARGADVTMITGPSNAPVPYGVEAIFVETALEMAEAVASLRGDWDAFISVAAVADYRVEKPAKAKRHRTGKPVQLDLVENPDIVAQVGASKRNGQVVVGFAAETDAKNLVPSAKKKLTRKKLDLIVANEVGAADSGFGADMLNATIIGRDAEPAPFAFYSKDDLASKILDYVNALL